MTWKRVRTLWLRWALALTLVAAWAWPLNGPPPAATALPSHPHPELLTRGALIEDLWSFMVAFAAANLAGCLTAFYYAGKRSRRLADHSERIATGTVRAAQDYAAINIAARARDRRIGRLSDSNADLRARVKILEHAVHRSPNHERRYT